MKIIKYLTKLLVIGLFPICTIPCLSSCKKLIEIEPPMSSITTIQTFSDVNSATSAVIALYSTLIFPAPGNSNLYFGNGALTIYCGLSSDELKPSFPNLVQNQQFWTNNIQPNLGVLSVNIWKQAYSSIYNTNACIEGLTASNSLNDIVKKQLIGEAKFIRAFVYFYLVNMFGDVPLITTTNWKMVNTLQRTPTVDVYAQIIKDLEEAQHMLEEDYSISENQRTRVNKWTAKALLSRTYLYTGEWSRAEIEASAIIENPIYKLNPDITAVFQKNSQETIWQLQANNTIQPYTLVEAFQLLPSTPTQVPFYFLTNELLNDFETGDLRLSNWTNTSINRGVTYHHASKYKYYGNNQPSNSPSEYYIIFRLAEQYLIRAEARAKSNNLDGSKNDINSLRARALLSNITTSDKDSIIFAIEHERRIELFAELGHRWFDLKRTNRANEVLSSIKGSNWQSTDQLYPIPYSELVLDPQLIQNPGY